MNWYKTSKTHIAPIPENFDTIESSKEFPEYKLKAGANDWECVWSLISMEHPEEKYRVWFTVNYEKFKGFENDIGSKQEQEKDAKLWAEQALQTYLKECKKQYKTKDIYDYSWQECCTDVLKSKIMKPYIKDWGVDVKKWVEKEAKTNGLIIESNFTPVPIKVEKLTPEILNLINKKMKSLGYDWRGPEDVKQLIKRHNNTLFSLDLYNAFKSALESSNKRHNTLENKKKGREKYPSVNWSQINQLGYTNDIREAGYITPEGNLIDLSGKRIGELPGRRSLDHREMGGTAGMQEFIAFGNIRMSITGNMSSCFFDIRSNPTTKQKEMIKNIASKIKGEIYLELQNGLGEKTIDGYYSNSDKRTEKQYSSYQSDEIIEDINSFFTKEYQSPLKKFLKTKFNLKYAKKKEIQYSKWMDVDSSFISHIAYFKALNVLEIKLNNGRMYLYESVPINTYKKLMNSDSKGQFFNENIRNKYKSRKIA